MKRHEEPRRKLEGWLNDGKLAKPEGETSVSLARALASRCGLTPEGREPDEYERSIAEALGEYPHYVFVLVDGLGINQKSNLPDGGFFASHLNRTIRSVFPSTTAAALTSLASGAWPATHAITGWFTHIPKHARTVIPLRGVDRDEEPIDTFGIPYADIMCVDSMYPKFRYAKDIYTYKKFRTGHFADWYSEDIRITGYRSLANAGRRIRRGVMHRVKQSTPSFSYVYFSQVDHLSHALGKYHADVLAEIADTDEILGQLRSSLPDDVRIVVTADHGHIDVPKERHYLLNHGDPMMKLLVCPPSGEARIPLFHVIDGKEEEFFHAFHERYGEDFTLITPEDVEALELYGPEPLSVETKSRIGTYMGVSCEADAIEYVSEGRDSVGHIGMHGGMSLDEVKIPLFIA